MGISGHRVVVTMLALQAPHNLEQVHGRQGSCGTGSLREGVGGGGAGRTEEILPLHPSS